MLVEDYRHAQRLVAETTVGSTVTMGVLRKKQKVDVSVKVGEIPDSSPRRQTTPPDKG